MVDFAPSKVGLVSIPDRDYKVLRQDQLSCRDGLRKFGVSIPDRDYKVLRPGKSSIY